MSSGTDKFGNFLNLPEGFRWMTASETEAYSASGSLDPTVVTVRVGGTDDDPFTDLAIRAGNAEEWANGATTRRKDTRTPGQIEQDERIKQNLRDVNHDFTGMGYQQFQDLFEDRDPVEFL